MDLIPYPKSRVIAQAQKWMNSSLVKINEECLPSLSSQAFFEENIDENIVMTPWSKESVFNNEAQKIIAQNAINFMFWDIRDDQFYRYQRQGVTGALAMFEAFNEAWHDPSSPLALAHNQDFVLSAKHITSMFGDIPNAEARAVVLNEVLSTHVPVLQKKPIFGLSQLAYRLAQNNQAFDTSFAYTLACAFPLAFEDGLLKKSQLATSLLQKLAQSFSSVSPVSLTAFADYQVPNVLRHHGVLVYSKALAHHIDHHQPLPPHSKQERAIRASCVLAVEKIAHLTQIPSSDIDYWIWCHRHLPQTPFHLTQTTLY